MKINVVWFKRDLRLRDHAPLAMAIEQDIPVLLLYVFEPSVMNIPEHSSRHWQFVWQSLLDLNQQLATFSAKICIAYGEFIPVLENLMVAGYTIDQLYSHQETGQKVTFDRDRAVKRFCQEKGIHWLELSQDGVQRGLSHRIGWEDQMSDFFNTPIQPPRLDRLSPLLLPEELTASLQAGLPAWVQEKQSAFQPGGEQKAWKYVQSFFSDRVQQYSHHLSKPLLSRRSCSRFSPYLAYGNLSVRELMQYTARVKKELPKEKWQIENFQSRLWWRSHHIQKLEGEWQIEFEPLNRGMKALGRHYDEDRFQAWATGQTGFPMVDASMRCLMTTGWLNFRMRAMLATFATFPLWLPWKPVATHLANLFLDFDPGIHFGQIQMNAGLSGYHTLRIYNPDKQASENDPTGEFIHQWVPELRQVPPPLLFQPWKMTPMDQVFYQTQLGKDYPYPMVDFEASRRENQDRYWEVRRRPATLAHLPAIWNRHCNPKEIATYERLNLSS